jgi:hypothetical protein
MDRMQIRMARIYAHELADALSAQITMHMRGVTADFPAADVAIENANDALTNIAKSMGFALTPLPSLEADVHPQAAE